MKRLSWFLLVVFICSAAFAAYLKPNYNWDMLGYMGCVIAVDEPIIDSIHAVTYRTAQAEIPAKEYALLVNPENDYRKKTRADPEFFVQQLSLYAIKPGFILLIYLLFKIGIPLTTATFLPSILSSICIGFLLFYWLQRFTNIFNAFIFTVLIMLSPPLWEIALSSTPDALVGLIALISFYFILERNRLTTGLVFLVACIVVRIDFVLLSLMTIFMFHFSRTVPVRLTRSTFLIFTTVTIFIFGVIAFGLGNFSWNTIGYYTIVQSDIAAQFGTNVIVQYFVLLVRGIFSSRYASIPFFLMLAVILFFLNRRKELNNNHFEMKIVLLLLLNILLRYLLHPVVEDRFLIVHYLVITIIFLRHIFRQKTIAPAYSE